METDETLRLTTRETGLGNIEVRIDGRLDARGLRILGELLVKLSAPKTITLDMQGLQSLDPVARDFLVGMRDGGSRLQGGSLYINRLLEEA